MSTPIAVEPVSRVSNPTIVSLTSDASPPANARYINRVTADVAGWEYIIPSNKSFLVQNEGTVNFTLDTQGNAQVDLRPGEEARCTWSDTGANHELQISATNTTSNVRGTVTRYSSDGSVSTYEPSTQTTAAYWDAAAAALTAVIDGDTIDFDSNIVALFNGTPLSISGKKKFTLRGGRFTRGQDVDYAAFLILTNCEGFEVCDMKFDGASGLQAPILGQTHVNTSENTLANATLLDLAGCSDGQIHDCIFEDHVGDEQMIGDWPVYFDANALRIQATCDYISVLRCRFQDIGQHGIQDDGENTLVDDCVFDNCLNQGIACHANGGSLRYKDCRFIRRTSTILGYVGGLNINPTVANGMISIGKIEDCVVDMPYDNTDGIASLQTHSVFKVQGIELFTISNCWLNHGLNTDPTNGRASVTIQDQMDNVTIEGCWFAGGVRHITRVNNPHLTVLRSHINMTAAANYAFLMWSGDVRMSESTIKYETRLIASPDATGRCTGSMHFDRCRLEPSAGTTQICSEEYIEDVLDKCCMGPTNTINGEIHGDGSHSKTDTVQGNLALSTRENDPRTKRIDDRLTGVQAHPNYGSAPDFAPEYQPGRDGMTVENTQYVNEGGPIATQDDITSWDWTLRAATFDNSYDGFDLVDHGLVDDDPVWLSTTGTLPTTSPAGEFEVGQKLYVKKISDDRVELSLTKGGATINGTDNGTGTHYLTGRWSARLPTNGDVLGSISVEDNSTATTISSSSTDFTNKVQILVFDTQQLSRNCDANITEDHIAIERDGDYELSCSISLSGGGNDIISYAFFKNNGAAQLGGVRATRKIGTGGDVGHCHLTCQASLVDGDTVEIWVQNETSSGNVTIEDGILCVRG